MLYFLMPSSLMFIKVVFHRTTRLTIVYILHIHIKKIRPSNATLDANRALYTYRLINKVIHIYFTVTAIFQCRLWFINVK